MDRQDTQPVFSDDDFSFLIEQHPSLREIMTTSQEFYPLFEELHQSSDKNNDDKQLHQQQIQHQQLVLHQQHQAEHQQPEQHNKVNNAQIGLGNVKSSQHLVMATMKKETIETSGLSLFSDSLSSTPPELLQGVPYSAIHTATSDALNGCTTLTLQNQVELYHNFPLSQVTKPNCTSNDINNSNYNNSLSNNYTVPQTQLNSSGLLNPPIMANNNPSTTASTSNYGPSKFAEPYTAMGPFSPATLETTDVIASAFGDRSGVSQQVNQQQQHMVAFHDAQEKKFAPQDQKFVLPGSINETMFGGDCNEGATEGLSTGLTRAKTIDVTTLNNWPGDYNFQISVHSNTQHKNKWCYSSKLHRLYLCHLVAAEVKVSINDWFKANSHNAKVRVVAVYQSAQHRTIPVQRCHNCKKTDKKREELSEHVIQVSNPGATYSLTGSRYSVSVPLVRSHLGEDSVTLILQSTCMSSCVGGPNRRPFALLFSLMLNGAEMGRQVLSTKCCKAPNRDLKKDETDYDRQRGLAVENNINTAPADPAVGRSPKKPNLAIAGSSGTTANFSSPKSSAAKRKAAARKMVITSEVFSSDSETDRSGSKKTKLGNICFAGVGRGTCVTTTDSTPDGYATLLIPNDIKNDVVKYAEGLLALKYVLNNKPNVLKSIELP